MVLYFAVGMLCLFKNSLANSFEPSNWALSELRKKYEPSLWIFGHWHIYREGRLFGTKWYCLSHPGQGERWWMYLPEKEVVNGK